MAGKQTKDAMLESVHPHTVRGHFFAMERGNDEVLMECRVETDRSNGLLSAVKTKTPSTRSIYY